VCVVSVCVCVCVCPNAAEWLICGSERGEVVLCCVVLFCGKMQVGERESGYGGALSGPAQKTCARRGQVISGQRLACCGTTLVGLARL
jgi:hypothetical protein